MKKFQHLAVAAILATATITNSLAQSNLGQDCGCPTPVSSRPTVVLGDPALNLVNPADSSLYKDLLLTCDKTYILDHKIYVPSGVTLTIMPGTVVKGRVSSSAKTSSALVVSVGGKLIAAGKESCPIVFTAEADNLDGTYPICNRGQWGGVVLLGKASNNLLTSNVYSGSTTVNGIGFIEGYEKANSHNHYGKVTGSFDDNDNSGVLKYVSIRHAGAVLMAGNELNGLSLGSVGRGTIIDHVEIVANDDDNIEFFGGTVNIKYCAAWWGNDDMFDYDLGWNGNAQFLFAVASPDRTGTPYADNGYEADGDDDKTGNLAGYMSHPLIYNTTLIGNGTASLAADFSGTSAIRAKERTEGEIYNSIFANFQYGLDISDTRSTLPAAQGTTDALQNWNSGSLIVKNNTFINMTDPTYGPNGICISTKNSKGTGTPGIRRVATAAELAKFTTTDGNTYATTLNGFDYAFGLTCGTNTITHKFDALPASNIAGSTPPANGFFTPVTYRGAFGNNEKSWLSGWSYGERVNATSGLLPCPNDVNNSGSINNTDMNSVLGTLGTSCQ